MKQPGRAAGLLRAGSSGGPGGRPVARVTGGACRRASRAADGSS
jgi:hypothetical protein